MILTKKSSRSLKLGYISKFLLVIAMQFQQINALPPSPKRKLIIKARISDLQNWASVPF